METRYHDNKLLTTAIWGVGLATLLFMVADVVVRPNQTWLSLMPVYGIAVFVLLHSITFFGPRPALWFLALGSILPFLAEYLGINFGAVFGSHWFSKPSDYNLGTGLMLPGGVTLASVLTWYGMLYLSFLVASYLVRSRPSNASTFASVPLAAGLVIAVWQLTAAPVAVARGALSFVNQGFYHDVPVSSFVGWFSTTLFILLFFQALEPSTADSDRFLAPDRRIALLPVSLFGLTLLYGTLMCFRLGLTGAGWLGVVFVLLMLLSCAVRSRSLSPSRPMERVPSPAS